MKGSRTIRDTPFRYGGIMHNYARDWDGWLDKDEEVCGKKRKSPYAECYCCGGKGGNLYSTSGTLLKVNYPYMAFYRITRGKNKGFNKCRIICRACAYDYGLGVIEMDGKTYKNPNDFNERKYKESINYECKWEKDNDD